MPIRTVIGPWHTAPICLPAGRREFAVGDVHGMSGLLAAILSAMAAEAGADTAGTHLTLLGDLVDRGPDSLGCFDIAGQSAEELGFGGVTLLVGNHEGFVLNMLQHGMRADVNSMWAWMDNGSEWFREEGERLFPGRKSRFFRRPDLETEYARDVLGAERVGLLRSAVTHRRAGNLLFVHAGVNPAVSFEDWFSRPVWPVPADGNWAWVREDFWRHGGGFEDGVFVVHGHTIEPLIAHEKGRLTLDAEGRWNPLDIHRADGMRLGLDGGSATSGIVAGAEFRDGGYRVYIAVDAAVLARTPLKVNLPAG
ncbi:metallophosphoesterase [Roseomonas gilardii]|uniref:metallophosphoesterase n=1 Tax=Roseomonas gilardii TaxID=257708 RepID=UPI0004812D41|nr:metallophosphoesterase [Roseomonas gilardii]SUE63184.1 Serine/threonine-protein phosphatase 1 [Roseomonas gilardii subsp. rosea]